MISRLLCIKKMEEKHSDSYDHVLKYTGVFGGVQGLNIIIGLVRNKIIAKLLGPAGMGLNSLFNSSVNFISNATTFGISFSAIRHVSELFEEGDEQKIAHFIKVVRGWSLLSALLGMLVCVLLGPALSNLTFAWGNHTLHFILLAPAVGMMAITGGETAILKGARQLKPLAIVQLMNVILALIVSVPVYFFYGQSGIVPVIVMMAFIAMALTLRQSYRLYPLRLRGMNGILGEGMEMIWLGIAFVFASAFGSFVEMFVRSYLNVSGALDTVGLYNAGFVLTMTYGGMVFSAMETDYFPRLSAVNNDPDKFVLTANRQIEVSVLIVAPMLVALIFGAHIIIPLLFSNEFLPIVEMIRLTTLALYLRAIKLPICYMCLAKGEAKWFMFQECSYYVVMAVSIIFGFKWWGLDGTGIALLVAAIFEFVLVTIITHFRYGYWFSKDVIKYSVPHLVIGVFSYFLSTHTYGIMYWSSAFVAFVASLSFSIVVLYHKTSLWNKLTARFRR